MEALLEAGQSILTSLWLLLQSLGTFLISLGVLLRPLVPVLVWVAWWYYMVDWSEVWPVLRRGGWVPALLAAVMIIYAWVLIDTQPSGLADRQTQIATKIGVVGGLLMVAVACGLFQSYMKARTGSNAS